MSKAPTRSTQIFQHGSPQAPFSLLEGELPGYQLAWQSWGQLNEDKSNAILIFHALSGTQHLAGHNPEVPEAQGRWTPELHTGWWNDFVGPGKPIDTDRHFVLCANYLGGCYGSTGPSSPDPRTGRPYGSTFPRLHIADLVTSQISLLDSLGIERLHAVIGPSVGGLCALSFSTLFPNRVQRVVPIASGFKPTVLTRLILFEQILAIENDPHFEGGDYPATRHPDLGLALARMISHKTFVHLDAIERRARQEIHEEKDLLSWYGVQDPFQSYMLYQGKKFTQRFDANTYLRIADMWSRFDPLHEARCDTPAELFAPCHKAGQQYLIFSIDSDFCFFPEEQAELVSHLERAEVPTMHLTVHSDKGHDSFLLEPQLYGPHLRDILEKD